MKFKLFLIIFNVLLIFSFLMMFILPIFMFGKDFAIVFIRDSRLLVIFFFLSIVAMNALYLANRKFVLCLENKNWQELNNLLKQYLLEKNRFRNIYIKLYVNTCITLSRIGDIKMLENKLRRSNLRVLKKHIIELGVPYISEGDPLKMKNFFGEFINENIEDSAWVRWNYCFALLVLKEKEEAVMILRELVISEKDKLLLLLSLYMLSPFRGDPEIDNLINTNCEMLKPFFSGDNLDREIKKQKENVQILYFQKIIKDASDWLLAETK